MQIQVMKCIGSLANVISFDPHDPTDKQANSVFQTQDDRGAPLAYSAWRPFAWLLFLLRVRIVLPAVQ